MGRVRKGRKGREGVWRERRRCRRVGRVGRRRKGIGGSRTFGRTRGRVQAFYKYTAKCLEKKKKNEIKAGKHIGGGVQEDDNNADSAIKPAKGERR